LPWGLALFVLDKGSGGGQVGGDIVAQSSRTARNAGRGAEPEADHRSSQNDPIYGHGPRCVFDKKADETGHVDLLLLFFDLCVTVEYGANVRLGQPNMRHLTEVTGLNQRLALGGKPPINYVWNIISPLMCRLALLSKTGRPLRRQIGRRRKADLPALSG
jgi:hypothetical protein